MAGRGGVHKRVWSDGRRVSWYIKYVGPDGRQRKETVGANKREAERVLAERISAINGGTFRELREATFEEYAEKWMVEYARTRLKPSTLDGYERYLANHLIPAFGAYPLAALTPGQIQEWVDGLLATHLSAKSVSNYLVPLRKMLGDAVKWGYLTSNPCLQVERPRVRRKEMQALDPAQIRRLLEAAEPEWRLLYEVATLTGLRQGELLALRWKDVDFRSRRLRVARSVWNGQFVTPKTEHSFRAVDLTPSLVESLREARPAGLGEDVGDLLIFSNRKGGPVNPRNLVQRHFEPTLRRAGLPRVRFHDLRHSYASLLILSGEHPRYIQAQLGHASITTTLDRYGHLLDSAYKHGGERLERVVFGEESP